VVIELNECPECGFPLSWMKYVGNDEKTEAIQVWCGECGWQPDTPPDTLPETVGKPLTPFKALMRRWGWSAWRKRVGRS
jgi:hypothetical protein